MPYVKDEKKWILEDVEKVKKETKKVFLSPKALIIANIAVIAIGIYVDVIRGKFFVTFFSTILGLAGLFLVKNASRVTLYHESDYDARKRIKGYERKIDDDRSQLKQKRYESFAEKTRSDLRRDMVNSKDNIDKLKASAEYNNAVIERSRCRSLWWSQLCVEISTVIIIGTLIAHYLNLV